MCAGRVRPGGIIALSGGRTMESRSVRTFVTIANELDAGMRRAIVARVIREYESVSANRKGPVDSWLKEVKVKGGFRSWQDTPTSLLLPAAITTYRLASPFWAYVFRAWLDLKPSLESKALEILEAEGIGRLCDCVQEAIPGTWDRSRLEALSARLAEVAGSGVTQAEARLAIRILGSGVTPTGEECPGGLHGKAALGPDADGVEDGVDDEGGDPDGDVGPESLESLRTRIKNLDAVVKALAPTVRRCGDLMAEGVPPVEGLAEDLGAFREEWEDLSAAVRPFAGTQGAEDGRIPVRVADLLEILVQFESDLHVKSEADATLLAVVRLRSSRPSPDLEKLRERARAAVEGEADLPPEAWVEAVRALVELCSPDVADDRVDELRSLVAKELGNAIAIAAVRRFIEEGPPESTPPVPPPSDISTPSHLPGEQSPGEVPEPPGATEPPVTDPRADQPDETREPVVPLVAEPPAETEAPEAAEPPAEPGTPSCTSQELARTALELPESERPLAAARTVWALAAEGNYPVAFTLAEALEKQAPPLPEGLPAALLKGLIFSERVVTQEDSAAQAVLEALTEADIETPDHHAYQARRAVYAALCLRPALLSRSSGAMGVLQGLEPGAVGNLAKIRELVVKSQSLGVELGPAILQGLHESGEVRAQLGSLTQECENWLEATRVHRLLFAGATDTWHRLLASGGVISGLIESVIANRAADRDRVAAEVERLSDERQVEKLIRTAEKEARGRKAGTNPIDARAYRGLVGHVQEALAFPRRWLELVGLVQDSVAKGWMQKFEHWRRDLMAAIQTGEDWLRGENHDGLVDAAERKIVLRSLQNLGELFKARQAVGPTGFPEMVLRSALLRMPNVELDDAWQPRGMPEEITTRLLQALAGGCDGWGSALDRFVREGNFLGAKQVLEVADAGFTDLDQIEERRAAVGVALEEKRAVLAEIVQARRNEVEQAVALDILNDSERAGLTAQIDRSASRNTLEFGPARAVLDAVATSLEVKYAVEAQDMARRVEVEGIARKDPEAFRRIQEALGRRDFPTATEYIDAVSRGEPLRGAPAADPFSEQFFPQLVRNCSTSEFSMAEVPGALATGSKVGLLDFAGLPEARREDAARLAAAWMKVKRRQDLLASLKALIELLGFQNVRVTAEQGPRAGESIYLVDVQVDEIHDRNVCVIPQFGSLAHGRYRLACVWGQVPEEELLSRIPGSHAVPVIALYLDVMREPRRRELARLTRERRRQILVLDESLLVFLATQVGARLPVLFRCALPFTVAEPYVTSAGLVPREMFFGRRAEMQKIFDRLGTNLVYGGRQLGKTALLREVERTHHDPGRGVIVAWTDLKQAGIGRERPARALWEVIGGLLEAHGVVKKGTVGFNKIRERVLAWLGADEARRIVLLLDEADMFLAADREPDDGRPYATLLDLKGLLDETQKRFKFVLAGLHDVQRTSRDPNTPLAHLGSPLCIGPLLENGEALEARALIEVPLETLGYRFEHADLPTRILSHTNYYPSLIQLFCWHLLDHVSNTRKVSYDPRVTPPFVITAQHVDEAYRSQKLRGAIRDRFKWTLELDPRYKLIALLIALESADPSEAPPGGFTARDIERLATSWWPVGFDDRSPEAFRTILDEMIGLGLLRKSQEGTYTLRSMNVLNVLGSKNEIAEEIQATVEQEPPKPHEYPQLRRAEMADAPFRRSPLTLTQEGRVLQRENGACAVFGAGIAERDFLPTFLKSALPQAVVETVDAPGWAKCEYALGKLLDRREPYTVLVAGAGSPWTEAWLEDANRMLRKRQSKDSTVRAIFLGSPADALRWCRLDPNVRDRITTQSGVETVCLAPWTDGALRAWFEDCQFGPFNSPAGRGRVREVTGGWAALVDRFGETCKDKGKPWEDHLAALDSQLDAEDLAKLFDIPQDMAPVLRALCELRGAMPIEDAAGLVEDPTITVGRMREGLQWATFLGFASPDGEGWRVDPVLARAMRSSK